MLVFLAETATGTPLGGVGSGGVGTLYMHGFSPGRCSSSHHEYYRLLTSGFLHDGLLHILFNMVFLYFVGPSLEAAVGKRQLRRDLFRVAAGGLVRRAAVDAAGPDASAPPGALFGLLGALVVVAHYRGISIWQAASVRRC